MGKFRLERDWIRTNARPEGSMEGREGFLSEPFEVPEGATVVAVKWAKFGDVQVTWLVPEVEG